MEFTTLTLIAKIIIWLTVLIPTIVKMVKEGFSIDNLIISALSLFRILTLFFLPDPGILTLFDIFMITSILLFQGDASTGWSGETYSSRNKVVFAERNQKYGAFELRENYNRRLAFVLLGMIGFSFVLFGVKKFMDRPKPVEVVETLKVEQIDLTPPPPAEELPPPPPPPPPPPMVEMVKFTPPVIKDDAVEEEPQKLQEEVKETQVGVKDQEGDKDLVAPPVEEKAAPTEAAPEIFTIVEEQAEFPGGIAEMAKYIQKTLQYPAMARDAGISGKCFLKFIVNENGDISNVEVLKGVPGCSDCDKEAKRVVNSMPKWKAAKMTGKAVKCYFNLPISFKIQ